MQLFGNKKSLLPPLTHFQLSLNLTKIEEWLDEKRLIPPTWGKSEGDDVETYPITLLPLTEFLFFHQRANQFSPSIGGYKYFGSKSRFSVEWNRDNDFFYVTASKDSEGKSYVIFAAPWGDILHLLVHRKADSTNIRKDMDGKLIEISEDLSGGTVSAILRATGWTPDGLRFSNYLATLSVDCDNPSSLVGY